MERTWKLVALTGRWYCRGEDRKYLVAGDDGKEPPRFWYAVFQQGSEIAHGEGLETIEAAQQAAERV